MLKIDVLLNRPIFQIDSRFFPCIEQSYTSLRLILERMRRGGSGWAALGNVRVRLCRGNYVLHILCISPNVAHLEHNYLIFAHIKRVFLACILGPPSLCNTSSLFARLARLMGGGRGGQLQPARAPPPRVPDAPQGRGARLLHLRRRGPPGAPTWSDGGANACAPEYPPLQAKHNPKVLLEIK